MECVIEMKREQHAPALSQDTCQIPQCGPKAKQTFSQTSFFALFEGLR